MQSLKVYPASRPSLALASASTQNIWGPRTNAWHTLNVWLFSNSDHKGNISKTKSPKAGAHQVYASLSPADMPGAPDAAVPQWDGGSESCHRVRPRS